MFFSIASKKFKSKFIDIKKDFFFTDERIKLYYWQNRENGKKSNFTQITCGHVKRTKFFQIEQISNYQIYEISNNQIRKK